MSNNAPDYEDNLVFPSQDDQIVGEPDGEFKKSEFKFTEEQVNNARVEAAKLIATAVGAATYELKDQLQIKDMRIRKLKQKNAELKELLKELFETADLAYCEDELLTKIEEVLK